MIDISGKTYWLIGASEGLGRELARQLNKAGAALILSARNETRLKELAAELTNTEILPFDVTDENAVNTAVAAIGDIDGIIYNAGVYDPMSATEWEQSSALKMLDVNFTGALRVLGHVVPAFVEKGRGDITLIGSLAAYRGLPAAIGYSASKAALRSLAETMRYDLKGTGVVVRLINPGFIDTRLTAKNDFRMPMQMTAHAAAGKVIKAMRKRRFRTDFPIPFSWFMRLIGLLPDFVIYRGK